MSANVLRKMAARLASRWFRSQSCRNSLQRFSIGNRPKFIEPMLRLLISGRAASAAASRSSRLIPWPPPVVMFTNASVACLIRGRNCMNRAGSGVGRPSAGSRACRWRMAAPASAAAIACRAISSGVTGRCGDIEGVWIEPVTAQVMIAFLAFAMPFLLFVSGEGRPRVRGCEGEHLWL